MPIECGQRQFLNVSDYSSHLISSVRPIKTSHLTKALLCWTLKQLCTHLQPCKMFLSWGSLSQIPSILRHMRLRIIHCSDLLWSLKKKIIIVLKKQQPGNCFSKVKSLKISIIHIWEWIILTICYLCSVWCPEVRKHLQFEISFEQIYVCIYMMLDICTNGILFRNKFKINVQRTELGIQMYLFPETISHYFSSASVYSLQNMI